MVVETGSGSATANSYCSVDDGDLYHEKRLHVTDWTGATDDDKEAALMWATRLIEQAVIWSGTAISTTQALAWPRDSVYDRYGTAIDNDIVPTWLIEATAEFARELIAENRTTETNRDLVGFKELKVGELAMKIDTFSTKPLIPPAVWSMINYYCRKVGRAKTLVRV